MHVRPKKHLGQHFLKEDAIAARIADALTHHGGYRRVLEVGPGTGALTRHLIPRTDIDLVCIEVDTESLAHLRAHHPDLRLIEGDFLRLDLNALGDGPFAVIGNFPYNISTQIIFKVLEHRDRCTEVVGMFQKEVADRIRAGHGSKVYGITSVLAQAYYDVELLFHVEPGSFIPPPKVRSSVIRLRRNATARLACDEGIFHRLVKAAFNQRRKTLANALRHFPGLEGGLPADLAPRRAEQLPVDAFVALAATAGPATV
jgi:16S rRNA (adenine1518-N6/adenine1519-N6)-dimethyltransferase